MSDSRFDARVDATPAVADGWLRPGELLDWTCPSRNVGYEVTGRRPNGKRRAPLWLRILGWIVLSPVMLILLIGTAASATTDINDWGEERIRRVIARGRSVDWLAARLADARGRDAFWVLTDRRFALVAAEPVAGHSPVVRLRTVWELPAAQYVYHRPVTGDWRRHAAPARLDFADGSSLSFPGLPQR